LHGKYLSLIAFARVGATAAPADDRGRSGARDASCRTLRQRIQILQQGLRRTLCPRIQRIGIEGGIASTEHILRDVAELEAVERQPVGPQLEVVGGRHEGALTDHRFESIDKPPKPRTRDRFVHVSPQERREMNA